MKNAEALEVLRGVLLPYRGRPYSELVGLITESVTTTVKGKSGVAYQVKIHAFWDDRPNGNLRVMGDVDDSGWRAFFPLGEDFIMAPDGTFVGE